ncbi:hypothetical protein SLS60_000510 [Paraconiothyrium brasiliense]|uniref:Uncharacterized protein n=1 Tax=Paraconiothyrium brasiliense TaxID=300254 RepID=A0ABR3S6G9_9PLEO
MFNNEDYVPERWHTSLIMIATLVVPFTFNLWFRKILNAMEIAGGVLHICLFVIFVVILIVFGSRSSDDFVFKTLIWESSGWNSKGVSFGLGDEIKQVHPILKLPVNALVLVGFIVICLSLIYIASATAYNALISLQTLALHVSYFLPILFMLIRRLRGPTPPYGPFKLGALGVPLNIFSLCFLTYVGLWMPFPQMLPVTKDNMNYAGPVFGAVIVGALLDWFLNGRKRFQMPVARYE